MLIDEILAVGDESFQRKCLARIAERMEAGATLVLVSHDPSAIERVCRRVVVLDDGKVAFDGDVGRRAALLPPAAGHGRGALAVAAARRGRAGAAGDRRARAAWTPAAARGPRSAPARSWACGCACARRSRAERAVVALEVRDQRGELCFRTDETLGALAGETDGVVRVPRLALLGGDYDVAVGAHDQDAPAGGVARPRGALLGGAHPRRRGRRRPARHAGRRSGRREVGRMSTPGGRGRGGARGEAERRRAAGGYAGRRQHGRAGRVDRARRAVARAAGAVGGDRDRPRRVLYSTRRAARRSRSSSGCWCGCCASTSSSSRRARRASTSPCSSAWTRSSSGRAQVTAVHQVLSSAGPYDAVSVQARLWRGCSPSAATAAPTTRRRWTRAPAATSRRWSGCGPRRGDLLVIRYSAYSPRLMRAAGAPRAQAARLPQRHAAGLLLEPPPGRGGGLRGGARAAAAVRARGRRVRRPTRSSTPASCGPRAPRRARAADPVRPGAAGAERGRAPEGDGPLVLVVSRLAPNKRHDLAIAAFAAWRAEHGARRAAAVRGRAAVARLRAS